jgi:hypothetical protein
MCLSTATPEKLPDIETLRRLTKSLAMLDAIMSPDPDWEYRYYSYNSKWGDGEEMASMRNGSGDEWFLLFDKNGAALKGLAHEYPLAGDTRFADRIQEAVPRDFHSFLQEPAFDMQSATFCIWRRHTDKKWSVVTLADRPASPQEDGSGFLISILDGKPKTYCSYARDYYDREIPLAAVEAIYRHEELSDELVAKLNPEVELSDLVADAAQIGYPDEGAAPPRRR